jgi:hypothetical protein
MAERDQHGRFIRGHPLLNPQDPITGRFTRYKPTEKKQNSTTVGTTEYRKIIAEIDSFLKIQKH